MNWLNQLLRKPAGPQAASSSLARPSAPAPRPARDPGVVRAAWAAAAGEDERQRLAEELGWALGEALQAPLADDDTAIWSSAVCHAGDRSVALDWLAQVRADAWLAKIAQDGRFAEVRLAAAQRVEDLSLVEQMARHSRGKDKGVYRHCTELLRRHRRAADHLEKSARLAEALRALLAATPVSVTHLLEREREMRALEDDGAQTLDECRQLLDQANARVLHEGAEQRRQQALAQAAAALSAQISAATAPDSEGLAAWRERHAELAREQAALPAWLGSLPAARSLAGCVQQIEEHLNAQAAEAERAASAEAERAAAAELERAAEAAREATQRAPAEAATEASAGAPAAEGVAPPVTAAAPVDPVRLHARLRELEQALDQGHLADGETAAKRIKSALGAATLEGRLEARMQRALARLADLRGWAQWGANKQREHLIAAAAELLGAGPDVEQLAVAVPALRQEWKRLNGQGPTGKGQWESFDAALTKAYQPVLAQRAREAQRRDEARGQKEALLARWEAELAAIGGDPPAEAAVAEGSPPPPGSVQSAVDFPALEARNQQMLEQWRAAPAAGFRDERLLRKRLDALLGRIQEQLGAARRAEEERRESLIAAAEALRDLADTRRATDQAKELQERWPAPAGSVHLARGEEQKLWRRFRAACDAVFTRRDAERAEDRAQREQRAQARAQLLQAFAAVLSESDPNRIKRALVQFPADWAAAGGGAKTAEQQEREARQLQQQARKRIDSLREQSYRSQLAQLAQQAAPDADADTLARGRQLRADLAIDLEIALGLPSPPSCGELRRRRQLEKLQDRFRTGRPAPAAQGAAGTGWKEAEKLLARYYATAAPPDADLDGRIAAVVDRLVAAHSGSGAGH
jgi:hypothetical protein